MSEWCNTNPGGTQGQFKKYWNAMSALKKKVRFFYFLLFPYSVSMLQTYQKAEKEEVGYIMVLWYHLLTLVHRKHPE